MSDLEKMSDLPAVLFPHSYVPESSIKKILSFFGPLTIFQPWFMERPTLISETYHSNLIQVFNPPSNLKPGKEFKTLLSEYHNWVQHNQDKSYMEFLKVNQETDLTENTTWEIRQMLRQMDQQAPIPQEDHALRCHLILHLAQEVEDQRTEADRVLKNLKEKDSPFKGIIEEEETDQVKSLLEDLPQFESEPIVDEYQLRQVLEAWFALFGGYLKGNEFLLTCNRHVIDYVTELWKELSIEGKTTDKFTIEFNVPDLSHHTLEDLTKIKKEHFNAGKIRDLRTLILDLGKDAFNNVSRLEKLSKDVETLFPWELSEGPLHVMVNYLPPLSDNGHLRANRVMSHLSNKTIILMEDASHYERG